MSTVNSQGHDGMVSYPNHTIPERASQRQTSEITSIYFCQKLNTTPLGLKKEVNQRTNGPENSHLKPDLGVFSHHEMTLTLNTHTHVPLLTSLVVCICQVSGLRLQ